MGDDTEFRKGDRVAMVRQPDERDPVPPGTEGTVQRARWVDLGGRDSFEQVSIAWDDGRTLMAVIPPDVITLVERPDPG